MGVLAALPLLQPPGGLGIGKTPRLGPDEFPSPRPAGADDAAERTDAPAASEWPGGSGAQPGAALALPAGAWTGDWGLAVEGATRAAHLQGQRWACIWGLPPP